MRVDISSRSLVAFVFLAIVAVSHAVVFWVPVWKQTTVLRYHPKKGWYPIKHGGTGSTFLKPKKLPPLAHIIKNAQQQYKKAYKKALVHNPISHALINHNFKLGGRLKHKGWSRRRPKPCPLCHALSSWKPSKKSDLYDSPPPDHDDHPHPHPPANHDDHPHPPPDHDDHPHPPPTPTRLKPRPKSKSKPKKPRQRPTPKPVPNFELDFPSPFEQRPFPPSDFLPKPNRRPYSHSKKAIYKLHKYNPFHKIIRQHFAPESEGNIFKKVTAPLTKLSSNIKHSSPPRLKSKPYFKSVVKPLKQVKHKPKHRPPLKVPQGKDFFSDFNDFPKLKGHRRPIKGGEDFLTVNNPGGFDFHSFPRINSPPKAPKVQTFFSLNEFPRMNKSPRVPKTRDFLSKDPSKGFGFNTFPQMNNPPQFHKLSTFYTPNRFAGFSALSPKPHESPRVPRVNIGFKAFLPFPKLRPFTKLSHSPKGLKPYGPPKKHSSKLRYNNSPNSYSTSINDFPSFDHSSDSHENDDDEFLSISNFPPVDHSPPIRHSPKTTEHHRHPPHMNDDDYDDDVEYYPKSNHNHYNNADVHVQQHSSGGGHHPFPKEFSSNFGEFGKGFGFSTGFSAGQRGQGWGQWVW